MGGWSLDQGALSIALNEKLPLVSLSAKICNLVLKRQGFFFLFVQRVVNSAYICRGQYARSVRGCGEEGDSA